MSQNLGHPDPTIRQALREWAKQRDELTHRRQEILDAAWRAGDRNIRGLAEDARVTRDTIYADLKALGLDRTTPINDTEENQ